MINSTPTLEPFYRASLDDLLLVGPAKPVGFLTKDSIEQDCNSTVEEQINIATSKGLKALFLYEPETDICNGALYVYDAEALGNLIRRNLRLLVENDLPTEPELLVRRIHGPTIPSPSLAYDFIADCFGDYTNRGRTEYQQAHTATAEELDLWRKPVHDNNATDLAGAKAPANHR